MCVNYRPATRESIRVHFDLEPPAFDYAWEVFAGQPAPVFLSTPIDQAAVGGWVWHEALFGLVPRWAKTAAIAKQTYNARTETVAEKPSFRTAWKRRQFCLVPMQAFFEPNYESGRAVRWSIARRDGRPFTAGAIWDTWQIPGGQRLHSFSMLTVNADAHPLMARFHKPGDEKRSLVIVPPAAWDGWMRGDATVTDALLEGPVPEAFRGEPAPLPKVGAAARNPDLFDGP
jgi:putative SOS response-associated peptidase YedK